MRIEVVNHWGACSTLILHQLKYWSESAWVLGLKDAIWDAENSSNHTIIPDFHSFGLEGTNDYGEACENREIQRLKGHLVKQFAFIMMTTLQVTPEEEKMFEATGFISSAPQHNDKNKTTIRLWYAHIPVFLECLRKKMDERKIDYSELRSYGGKGNGVTPAKFR